MIKNIIVFLIFFFSFLGISYAYFCDWYIENQVCNTWSIVENIDNISSFNSDYNDIQTGYLWNKSTKTNIWDTDLVLWYFWNKFRENFSDEKWSTIWFIWTKRTSISAYYSTPVWNFWQYKNQNVVFVEQEKENDFSNYPLINYSNDESLVVDEQKNNTTNIDSLIDKCEAPELLTGISVEQKNYWILDYIHIVWKNPWNEKVKVIRSSPEYEEVIIDNWKNYYDDFDIRNWSYSYFVIVYNDCYKSWIYSDLLKIDIYWINEEILENFLNEKQAFKYIYNSDNIDLLYTSLYLNILNVKYEENLTYWKTSLYISNILWKIYISSEKFTFDFFIKKWLVNSKYNINDKIKEWDFLNLLWYINKNTLVFQNDLNDFLDENYWKKEYNTISKDLWDNLDLIIKLKQSKNSNLNDYNNLLTCINWSTCVDLKLMEWVDKNPWSQQNNVVSYRDYIKELYYTMWYWSFTKKSYSIDNYNKFIEILTESITYWNDFYDTKLTYLSYVNLQSEILLQEKLYDTISYLTENHLEKINLIYESSKREELLVILRDFLDR